MCNNKISFEILYIVKDFFNLIRNYKELYINNQQKIFY